MNRGADYRHTLKLISHTLGLCTFYCIYIYIPQFVVVQLLGHVTLCNSINRSTPEFPVLHYLLVRSNLSLLSRWCHSTISSSVAPFSSCPQSFPAWASFPMSWLFASGGLSIEASTSDLPMNIQDWFPLGWTGLISLLSKRLSRVFSSTIQKHQFLGAQPSIWSNSL